MTGRLITLGLAAALFATPAMAQDDDKKKADAKRALAAIELPEKAKGLRDSGMDDAEVAEALTAAEKAGVSAADTIVIIDAAESAEDGDAWQGNFGSYVKSQVESGKRGKELAEAIHAEKAVRKADKEAQKAAGTWKGKGDKGAEKAEAGKARGAEKKEAGKAKGAEKKDAASGKGKGKNQ